MAVTVSPMCRQKASFLATSSVEKAGNIFGAAIFLVLFFSFIIEILNVGDDDYEDKYINKDKAATTTTTATTSTSTSTKNKKRTPAPRPTTPPKPQNKWILDKFLIATPLMALNGLSFALIILANQHSYYCEPWAGHGTHDRDNWKATGLDTPRDWIFIGLFPGLLALCGLSNWLRAATNVFLARWKVYVPLKRWPPALPILAIVLPVGAAVMLFYRGCLWCFKVWIREPDAGDEKKQEGSGADAVPAGTGDEKGQRSEGKGVKAGKSRWCDGASRKRVYAFG